MDVELVIKIDESKLWSLKNEPIKENFNIYELASYIDKGVPLPKGHGRLIDESDLIPDSDYEDGMFYAVSIGAINGAPTIIEADKRE